MSVVVSTCLYVSIFVSKRPQLSVFFIICQYFSLSVSIFHYLSADVSSCHYLSVAVSRPLYPPQVLRVSSGLPPARATWVVDSSSSGSSRSSISIGSEH